ncbi:MAG: sigma-54-dependent Fis family transcriptional regulator [Candidatus Abyssobacteria bacterium SURF_17]|uniref:Sigma-54-dependent Fis family transcriptional regulator n=1 Tax=Candidatus Abyssobacteria bacterium SURF_17 TaxID=2093361 RepID=A0A419F919_9BACT|nr:MAG: sigma-54-dependent Fis family transcriptional regulator [Candidatus Abyssubacteria bacterium SURF_17]
MSSEKILLVDDDSSLRKVLEFNLEQEGYAVMSASSGREALTLFDQQSPDVVITDIKMPGMDGIELLKEIKRRDIEALVIVITAFGTIDTAIDAMKLGAYDYITKPFNRDELKLIVRKALELHRLRSRTRLLEAELVERFSFENIIGGSARMAEVFQMVRRVAPSNVTVLIKGESGTGKELVARAIHYNSPRAKGNFIAVNCSAIPENLIESELFGHKKGAFTGAVADKVGKFELSSGGTIFLDEVADLRFELQAKLLRVLQEKEIERVGDPRPIKVDIRVIAATNKNLEAMLKNGEFREDLYHRINVVPIALPPLRERSDDIPLLVHHFKNKFNETDCRIEPEALSALKGYAWPGNVRELENVVQRSLLLRKNPDRLTVDDVPDHIRSAGTLAPEFLFHIPDEGIDLEQVERELLLYGLRKHGWNQTRAAKFLGITRQALIYRMEKYGLKSEKPGEQSEE